MPIWKQTNTKDALTTYALPNDPVSTKVGINVDNPAHELDVIGSIKCTGDLNVGGVINLTNPNASLAVGDLTINGNLNLVNPISTLNANELKSNRISVYGGTSMYTDVLYMDCIVHCSGGISTWATPITLRGNAYIDVKPGSQIRFADGSFLDRGGINTSFTTVDGKTVTVVHGVVTKVV